MQHHWGQYHSLGSPSAGDHALQPGQETRGFRRGVTFIAPPHGALGVGLFHSLCVSRIQDIIVEPPNLSYVEGEGPRRHVLSLRGALCDGEAFWSLLGRWARGARPPRARPTNARKLAKSGSHETRGPCYKVLLRKRECDG